MVRDKNLRMLRQLQCGSDSDSSRACPLDPKRVQHLCRLNSCRPDRRMRFDRTGCFHASWSASDHHESQHGAAFLCIRLAARLL